MTTVAELKARIAADQAALAEAINFERATKLQEIREDIKLYGFKTTDFKGVLATRTTKAKKEATAAKKAAAAAKMAVKKTPKVA